MCIGGGASEVEAGGITGVVGLVVGPPTGVRETGKRQNRRERTDLCWWCDVCHRSQVLQPQVSKHAVVILILLLHATHPGPGGAPKGHLRATLVMWVAHSQLVAVSDRITPPAVGIARKGER